MPALRRKLPHELVLPRRTLLRGVAGGALVALSLPLLDAMLDSNGEALADGTPLPLRFMTWMWGVGVRLEHWVPKDTGPSYTLSDELAPLAKHQSDFTLLSGFKNYVAGRRGHHDGMAGLFSGYPFFQLDPMGAPYASKFGGPSIDQVVADRMPQTTMFKSLQLGVTKRQLANQGPTLATMSHRGPDEPLDMERDPQAAYDKLFTAFMPKNGSDPDKALRSAAIDAVMNDVKRLQVRVGANDKARLDAHLTSLFDLQKQILAIPPQCNLPQRPDPLDPSGDEALDAINEVMSQIVATAFACDLTRVVSYMFTAPSGDQEYTMLTPDKFPQYPGAQDLSHASEHQESHVNAPYEQNYIHLCTIYNMQQLAVTLDILKSMQEGAGTLLDNMCMLIGTDVCEGWDHSENDYPILIAGKAGGHLKSGVGHYRSPGAPDSGESLADVGLACIKAVVPNPEAVTQFGGDCVGDDSAKSFNGHASTTPCAAMLSSV